MKHNPHFSEMPNLRILARAQENKRRLDECPQHEFDQSDIDWNKIALGDRIRCKRCNGRMLLTEARQYIAGFKAAGGNPNLVLEGYEDDGTRSDEHRNSREDQGSGGSDEPQGKGHDQG